MGCDIHAYVDYEEDIVKRDGNLWVSNLGEFHIGRDYLLFGILAGVRCAEDKLFDPKGLPDQMSYVTSGAATLFVVDHETEEQGCCTRESADRWHQSWLEQKARWDFLGERAGIGGYTDAEQKRIHHPDWHSHSWLTTDELRQVIEKYASYKEPSRKQAERVDGEWVIPEGYMPDPAFAEFFEKKAEDYEFMPLISKKPLSLFAPATIVAVYKAMQSLEESGYKPRFVFWFDN